MTSYSCGNKLSEVSDFEKVLIYDVVSVPVLCVVQYAAYLTFRLRMHFFTLIYLSFYHLQLISNYFAITLLSINSDRKSVV